MPRPQALPRSALIFLALSLAACVGDDQGDGGATTAASDASTTAASESTTEAATAATASEATSMSTSTTSSTSSSTSSTSSSSSSSSASSDDTSETSCENFLPPIDPSELAAGMVGVAYEVAFSVPGLDAANTLWMIEGAPPAGLSFDTVTGVLSGTPTSAGEGSFALIAAPLADSPECPTLPTSTNYTLVIDP